MDYMHDLKDLLCAELEDSAEKVKKAGKMSMGDLEVIDKLTHSLKSIKTVMSMEEEEGYSANSSYAYDNGNSNRGGSSYRGGNSYRGRRRDSMGRYSQAGYSRNDLSDKMRMLMDEAPDEHTRSEIQRMIEKLENV